MRKSVIVMILVLFLYPMVAGADPYAVDVGDYLVPGEYQKLMSICPKTKMVSSCMSCHTTPNWKIRESDHKEGLNLPFGLDLISRNNELIAYTLIEQVGSSSGERIKNAYEWLELHPKYKYWLIELHSPGGSMMGMKRIKSYMDQFKASGGTIETQVSGFAASAAFDILINGTMGKRYVHPQAILMWHEVSMVKWGIFIESVSDLEDQAEIMRKFQEIENNWIASRSNVTKEELNNMIKRKELWISGLEAVQDYGFADGFIGNGTTH